MGRSITISQIDKCSHCHTNKATIFYRYIGVFSMCIRLLCKKCYDEMNKNQTLNNPRIN